MSLNNENKPKVVKATITANINKSLDANISAGIDNLKANIKADIASSKGIPQELFDHLVDYENPHKVTAEQLGIYTKEESQEEIKVQIDDRIFTSEYELPVIGKPKTLYFITNDDEESTYIWDENTNSFRCVGSNYKNIELIDGGNANVNENA